MQYVCIAHGTRMHDAAIHVVRVLVGVRQCLPRPSGISQAAAIAVNRTQGVLTTQ